MSIGLNIKTTYQGLPSIYADAHALEVVSRIIHLNLDIILTSLEVGGILQKLR